MVRAAQQEFSNAGLFGALWICFFLGMLYYAYSSDFDPSLMIKALGWCRFCAPWSQGALGGWESFLVQLKYFGYLLPSLTVLIAHRRGWLRPHAIVGVTLSLIFVAFLAQEGGRRVIGVTLGAALITWLLMQRRLKPKFLVGGLVGAIIVLVSMELMLHSRQYGFGSSEQTNIEGEGLVHVDDNFLRLSQIMHLIPDEQPHAGLQQVFYLVALPIPRVFWEGKPSDPGYSLADMLEIKNVSLTASIIGDLYAMYGLISVFIGGFLIGCIAKMWNKILAIPGSSKTIAYSLGVMVLVVGLRSLQDLVLMSYGVIAWLALLKLLRPARPEQSRNPASHRVPS
jgi:hypothetical protein